MLLRRRGTSKSRGRILLATRACPLVQGYGLTESSPVISTCTPDRFKLGSVGPAVENVEIKIADDGEILTRGPHVMLGYWNRPTETAAAIENGWLHTGDLGRLDADGYLFITGRKKELIVTAGGKNIAPLAVESLLAEEPLIHQAIVIGEGAAVFDGADRSQSRRSARGNHRPENTGHFGGRGARPSRRVEAVSQADRLPPGRLVGVRTNQRFALLPRAFGVEQEEVTPTMKLRRSVINDHFAGEINHFTPNEMAIVPNRVHDV